MKANHPGVFEHVRKWVDACLAFMYGKHKNSQVLPSTFVKKHRAWCGLVLPLESADILFLNCGSWAASQQHVIAVVHSSDLGKAMFGFAVEEILGALVKKEVQQFIDELLALDEITTEIVKTTRKELLKDLMNREGMAYLSAHREIEISYRGVALAMLVSSLSDEVDMRLAAALRAEALRLGMLPGLACELELIEYVSPITKDIKIDALLLADNKAMMETAISSLKALDITEGSKVVEHLNKDELKYRQVDERFDIECAFFRAILGEGGEKMLESKILAILPTETRRVTETAALQRLRILQTSELYKFTGTVSQGSATMVADMIKNMLEGQSPSFPSNPSDFVKQVQVRMAYFCSAKEGTDLLVGAPAAIQWATAAIGKADCKLDDLEQATKFSWLLQLDQQQQVRQKADSLVEAGKKTLASAAAARNGGEKRKYEHGGSSSSSASASASCSGSASKKGAGEFEKATAMFAKMA